MDISKPLPVVLFAYEVLRFLALVFFLLMANLGEFGMFAGSAPFANNGFFPHVVYVSTNALFPLMMLFVWLRPGEYQSYLTLYTAGKIIAVVSFFAWAIFTPRELTVSAAAMNSVAIFGASILINMADVLSIWGAWALKNKYRKADSGGF
ncbi:MAG: hypothetical protein FWB82_05790 [Treponema sp.]|nr:hypothetical protein [Treponema sp.]